MCINATEISSWGYFIRTDASSVMGKFSEIYTYLAAVLVIRAEDVKVLVACPDYMFPESISLYW